MPIPTTKGALPVTASNFEAPYTTPTFRPGVGGLNLRKSIDLLEPGELSRMQNLTWDREGQLTTRPGLQALATTGGTRVHSIRRLVDPLGGLARRVWGIDTSVYIGLSGGLSSVDSGYSGDPLSIVPYRPTLSGQTWAYIADRLARARPHRCPRGPSSWRLRSCRRRRRWRSRWYSPWPALRRWRLREPPDQWRDPAHPSAPSACGPGQRCRPTSAHSGWGGRARGYHWGYRRSRGPCQLHRKPVRLIGLLSVLRPPASPGSRHRRVHDRDPHDLDWG